MDEKLMPVLNQMIGAIRSTDTYHSFAEASSAIEADEVLNRLMKRYEQVQLTLQATALAGSEPAGEDVEEFRRLNLLLLDSEPASSYLMAKMKYDQTLSEIFDYLSSRLNMTLPGRKD